VNAAIIKIINIMLAIYLSILSVKTYGHPGGLNSTGCHNNRKTGEYHCHRDKKIIGPLESPTNDTALTNSNNISDKISKPRINLPPGCYVGPRGGTYTITKSGRKNYSGC